MRRVRDAIDLCVRRHDRRRACAKRSSAASSSIASTATSAAALAGVLVYSVLFGLGHYEQGYDATIATACLGASWGFVYLRRRSIVAPVVSHAGFNLAQVAEGTWRCASMRLPAVAPRAARSHAPLRRVAAGGDRAAVFVRRGPVLLLPALALLRPRRLVRERVPLLLRSRNIAQSAGFHETFLERADRTSAGA